MSRRMVWWGLGAVAWFGAAAGILSLNNLPGGYVPWLCGPWGCLSSIWSLLAIHGFWFLFLVPFGIGFGIKLPPLRAQLGGKAIMGLALLAILIVTGQASRYWLTEASSSQKEYVLQHTLLSLSMQVDVPGVQTFVAGAICWGFGRFRGRSTSTDKVQGPKDQPHDNLDSIVSSNFPV